MLDITYTVNCWRYKVPKLRQHELLRENWIFTPPFSSPGHRTDLESGSEGPGGQEAPAELQAGQGQCCSSTRGFWPWIHRGEREQVSVMCEWNVCPECLHIDAYRWQRTYPVNYSVLWCFSSHCFLRFFCTFSKSVCPFSLLPFFFQCVHLLFWLVLVWVMF